jgi:cell division protein FtsB
METRLDNGQAVVEELRNQAAELRRELTVISETHEALNEKYKKLMDEEDEEQRGKLLDEMKEIMQEAESNSDY